MTLTYILSQVFTVIAYSFFGASFLAKKRKSIVIINMIGVLFNAVAFILLNAWTGLAMCIVSTARALYSLWSESGERAKKQSPRRDLAVLIVTIIATLSLAIPAYNGFLSLMSVFGSIVYNYSIWQKNTTVFKFLGIPVGLLWIVYNAFIRSIFGVILELVLLVFSISGFVSSYKEIKKAKNGKQQPTKRHA